MECRRCHRGLISTHGHGKQRRLLLMDLWLTGRIYCFLPFEASPVFIPVKVGGSEIFFFPLIQVFFFPMHLFPRGSACGESSCLSQKCDLCVDVVLPGLSPVLLCAARGRCQTFSLFGCSMKGKSVRLGACHASRSPGCSRACH